MKKRTERQVERQHFPRNNGKYGKVNPCYCCGKSAGVSYYSDGRVDVVDGFSRVALVLCRRCAIKGEDITDNAEALAFYTKGYEATRAAQKASGEVPGYL